jgi:uncharacterized protein YukE
LGAKLAVWNAKLQSLALILNAHKVSVHHVEKAVAKAGHDAQKLKASDADYANLHHCCSYARD